MEEQLSGIIGALQELADDNTVPRNIKIQLEEIISSLKEKTDRLLRINKALSILEEISEVEESPIIVSEGQKIGRINEIKEKAVSDLYPESRRIRLREDLEEMAYVFYRLDEAEYARLSLLAAVALNEKDSSIKANPFLRFFIEHSLAYYIKMRKDNLDIGDMEDDSSSLIITP